MVVVRGVSGLRDSADSRIVEAIETGMVRLAISDAGVNELVRVMSYPDVEALVTKKPGGLARAISAAVNLVMIGTLHHHRGLHWPNLNDANDSWLLDLALKARPDYIVTRDNGVLRDAPKSGFDAITPPEFVERENLCPELPASIRW